MKRSGGFLARADRRGASVDAIDVSVGDAVALPLVGGRKSSVSFPEEAFSVEQVR
jgi:hypothetical protein